MTHINIGLVKISVLLFYKRIFRGGSFMRIVNTLLALVCVWTVTTFFVSAAVAPKGVFHAEPFKLVIFCYKGVSSFWTGDINDPGVNAVYDLSTLIMATAIVNVAFDAAILSVPIPPILKLQMSTKRKVALIGIFLLGAL